MNTFELLNDMIRLQREHGGAQVDATAYQWNELKMALAAMRRKNASLYAVKLSAERLMPEEQFRGPGGGLVVVRLRLLPRKDGEKVTGQQAARLRADGIAVDGQTRARTTAEIDEEAEIERHGKMYEIWKWQHPEATEEQAESAGFGPEWRGDRQAERRHSERRHNEHRDSSRVIEELMGWHKGEEK